MSINFEGHLENEELRCFVDHRDITNLTEYTFPNFMKDARHQVIDMLQVCGEDPDHWSIANWRDKLPSLTNPYSTFRIFLLTKNHHEQRTSKSISTL